MRLLRSPRPRPLVALYALAVSLLGCGSDAERPGADTASASGSNGAGAGGAGAAAASSSASGGSGGSGGIAGSGGGTAAAGGTGEIEYRAINLITGAPRFLLTKKDTDRDICFQLRVLMGAGETEAFTQPGPPFEELLVAQGADACGETDGPPPSEPPPTAVAASDADGDIAVSQPPCTVTASFMLTFDESEGWVPANEPFDVQALPIEQGCP